MAFIVEQFAGDRGIQLGVESLIRPMQFSTNWTKIRVGARWSLNGYAVPGTSASPVIGICLGNTASVSNACVDAVYVPLFNPNALYFGGTTPAYFVASGGGANNQYATQRVGAVSTTFGSISSTTPAIACNPSALQCAFFVDIQKSAATNQLTIGTFYPNSTQVLNNLSRSNYLALVESETTTLATWLTLGTAVTGTLPIRTTRDWDSAFVGWVRSTPTLCVYDITVVRFA